MQSSCGHRIFKISEASMYITFIIQKGFVKDAAKLSQIYS